MVEITGEILNNLADAIRAYTAEAMKIDMAPWVKGYSADVGELYTELTLEQVEHTPAGCSTRLPESYNDIFSDSCEDTNTDLSKLTTMTGPLTTISILLTSFLRFCFPSLMSKKVEETKSAKSCQTRGQKILVKGELGVGKTTLVKKITYDWTKGMLKTFSLILFVSLKLVRPGESIENIIIQQTPALEYLNLSKEKFNEVVESFGNRCLLILDGLDEHDLGSNDEILKVIEGRKLLSCNILVTARPLSAKYIGQYFQTIVNVKGFSEHQTKKFVSKVTRVKHAAEAISDINTRHFLQTHSSEYTCPILILFVCILVNSGEMNFAREHIPIGEIYASLVRCLYRRFVIRKGIRFHRTDFTSVFKRVGHLAWEILQSGSGWLLLREVVDIVGPDAFEYGFFTGHEDLKSPDETTRIFITFPHDSILQFFGSFYFIEMLNDGESIQSLLGSDCTKPIFMTHPLFLTFCLWFLSDECNENHFSFPSRNQAYDTLVSHTVNSINFIQLNLSEMAVRFPIFQMSAECKVKDQTFVKFLKTVFAKCQNIDELSLNRDYPIPWISELMSRQLPWMQVTVVRGENLSSKHLSLVNSGSMLNDLVMVDTKGHVESMNTQAMSKLSTAVCPNASLDDNRPNLDLASFMDDLGRLRKLSHYFMKNCLIIAKRQIRRSPFLTEISFVEVDIDDSVLIELSNAVQMNFLPNLMSLSFERCGDSLKGKLSVLFGHKWSTLAHLNLRGSHLDKNDLMILPSGVLPKLSSLALSLGDRLKTEPQISIQVLLLPDLRSTRWPNITELWLDGLMCDQYSIVAGQLNEDTLPNLNELGLSMLEYKPTHEHLDFGDIAFPPLKISRLAELTLHRFICSAEYIHFGATKYISLQKLNLSHSLGISGNLDKMLSEKFPSLNSLILSDCGLNSQNLYSLAQASVQGRLPQLRHINISRNSQLVGQLECLFKFGQHWRHLHSLDTQQDILSDGDFQLLVDNIQSGSIRNLNISAQRVDSLQKGSWPDLNYLHVHCPLDLSIHVGILESVLEAAKQQLTPNLSKVKLSPMYVSTSTRYVYLDPTKTNDLLSPYLNGKIKQILKSVRDSLITRQIAIESLTDLALDMLKTIADLDMMQNPDFHNMLCSMMDLTLQAMDNSQPLDWEAMSKVARQYCKTRKHSDECEMNLSVVSLLTDITPTLQGFMDYGTVVNLQKLSDIKYKLRKLGTSVHIHGKVLF